MPTLPKIVPVEGSADFSCPFKPLGEDGHGFPSFYQEIVSEHENEGRVIRIGVHIGLSCFYVWIDGVGFIVPTDELLGALVPEIIAQATAG